MSGCVLDSRLSHASVHPKRPNLEIWWWKMGRLTGSETLFVLLIYLHMNKNHSKGGKKPNGFYCTARMCLYSSSEL